MRAINWKNQPVLITGATGLLGSHLVRRLLELGANVVALVRDTVPRSLYFHPSPEWNCSARAVTVYGCLEDFALLNRALNEYEIETVFHVGAQTIVGVANSGPLSTFSANIQGTWNLLEAVRLNQRRVRRVVVASSDKAYGNLHGDSYDETFPLRGEHPYDVSKSCADLLAQSYFKSYQTPVAITRCGNFFGPGDLNFNRLIPGTILSACQNESPVIRSNGTFIRDYLYVEDAVAAYLTLASAMQHDPEKKGTLLAGEAFNFSYGFRLSVLEVVERVLSLMQKSDLKPQIQNSATNEIPIQTLSNAKARTILDWNPAIGFEEGLRRTIAWYVSHFAERKIQLEHVPKR